MVERSRIRLLTGALASVLLPGLSSCAWRPYEGPLRGYPPRYYDYYYYPHEGVYYHIYTGHYYYRDGPVWWSTRRLPSYILLDPGYRIWLRIRDDKPWHRHHEHRRKYPPPPRPPHYYDYWYYPYWGVYFHIHTGRYFYRDGRRWQRVQRLPPHIHLDRRRRHLLNIRESRPWERHEEHRRQYPPPESRPGDGPAGGRVPGPPAEAEPGLRPPPDIRREGDRDRGLRRAPSPGIPSDRDRGLRPAPSPGSPRAAPPDRLEKPVPVPEPRRGPAPVPSPQPPGRRTPSPEIRRSQPPPEPRRGTLPARPERPAPPPALPPQHRRDRERDRQERQHNTQQNKEYRKKPWWLRQQD